MNKGHTFFALLTLALNCFGQGTVNFNNNFTAGGDHLVYSDFPGGTKLVGTNYVAELYYGPLGMPEASLVPLASSISHFRVTSTTAPGTWSGKTVTLPIGGVNVPISLEVKVWDITLALTWEEALAGGYGSEESGRFTYTQLSSIPPAATDTEMVNMPPIPAPEPAVLDLSLFGVLTLMVFGSSKPQHLPASH